jgi:hypothetical protein
VFAISPHTMVHNLTIKFHCWWITSLMLSKNHKYQDNRNLMLSCASEKCSSIAVDFALHTFKRACSSWLSLAKLQSEWMTVTETMLKTSENILSKL